MDKESPWDFLDTVKNKRVIVGVKGNCEYRGVLSDYDKPHLNVVLKDAEEIVNDEVKRKLSTVIIRGGCITYISP